MLAIRVEQLTKTFGSFRALDGCCLEVEEGQVFGLLGPNGAGKTTLIRTLLGYLKATSGSAFLFGRNCHTESELVRSETSYLPAEAKLFRTMRGKEVLRFFASFHPRGDSKRSLEMADRLQLDLSRRVAFMSTGMRQKLALAMVFSCRTRLLILDEPTANLDPSVRQEVMRLVLEAKEEGKTILFCSHVLQEVEEICDQAAIARAGSVVHSVNISELKSVHRLTGMLSDTYLDSIGLTRQMFFEDPSWLERFRNDMAWIPASIQIQSLGEGKISIDIPGAIEAEWSWIQKLPVVHVRIEPVGLRGVYERFHHPRVVERREQS